MYLTVMRQTGQSTGEEQDESELSPRRVEFDHGHE